MIHQRVNDQKCNSCKLPQGHIYKSNKKAVTIYSSMEDNL